MTGVMSLAMIRVIGEHAVSAIELLRQHDTHQRVRERELRQRPLEVGAREHFRREAVGTADEEREVAAVAHALTQPARELLCGHFLAALVESDDEVVLAERGEQALAFDFDRALAARSRALTGFDLDD